MTTTQLAPPTSTRPIRRLRETVRGRPLTSFFVLAFLGSWVGWTPYVLSENGLGLWGFTFPGGDGWSQLTGVLPGAYLGPIGAAALVTALADGRAGLRTWVGRLFRWRVGWRWYAGVLLGVPSAMVLLTIAVGGEPTAPSPLVLVALVPGLLLQMLTTGLAEEPGWRDFALPRLQHRLGALGAAALLGPLWGAWHLPLFLSDWDGFPDISWYQPVLFIAFSTMFNVIITWVFNCTRESLPIVMLLHVSVNNTASIAWSEIFPTSSGDLLQVALLIGSTLGAVMALVVTRGRLGYVRR